jgi:hypothetical protein
VLLNDVTYVEAARGLAARMMRVGKNASPMAPAVAGRSPKSGETAALQSYFDEQLAVPRQTESARDFEAGESPVDATLMRTRRVDDDCERAPESRRNDHPTLKDPQP